MSFIETEDWAVATELESVPLHIHVFTPTQRIFPELRGICLTRIHTAERFLVLFDSPSIYLSAALDANQQHFELVSTTG